MGALFDDVTIIEDKNSIGVADCGKAMGDNNRGFIVDKRIEGFVKLFFGSSIDRTGGFVKNHNVAVGNNRPRDGNQLLLPKAKILGTFGNWSFVFFFQARNKAIGTRHYTRVFDLFVACFCFTITNILCNATSKKSNILQHHSHIFANGKPIFARNILAIN